MRRVEMRRVHREWAAVERAEAVAGDEGDGSEKPGYFGMGAAWRSLRGLGRRLVGW
jgi:hypothetical protein